jgi:glutathione S-transferase
MTGLRLTGFGHSVYTRAVRMALFEKGLDHDYDEVMPFSEEGQAALAGLHPFGRVPVMRHDDFEVYETAAILVYLDAAFGSPTLYPDAPRLRARVTQVQGIVDSYLYWPLVRQAFGQAVYAPLFGEGGDGALAAAGMAEAPRILGALEAIAGEGLILNGRDMTRADCHLAPMMDYVAQVPGAEEMLAACPALSQWLTAIATRDSFCATRPDFLKDRR